MAYFCPFLFVTLSLFQSKLKLFFYFIIILLLPFNLSSLYLFFLFQKFQLPLFLSLTIFFYLRQSFLLSVFLISSTTLSFLVTETFDVKFCLDLNLDNLCVAQLQPWFCFKAFPFSCRIVFGEKYFAVVSVKKTQFRQLLAEKQIHGMKNSLQIFIKKLSQ